MLRFPYTASNPNYSQPSPNSLLYRGMDRNDWKKIMSSDGSSGAAKSTRDRRTLNNKVKEVQDQFAATTDNKRAQEMTDTAETACACASVERVTLGVLLILRSQNILHAENHILQGLIPDRGLVDLHYYQTVIYLRYPEYFFCFVIFHMGPLTTTRCADWWIAFLLTGSLVPMKIRVTPRTATRRNFWNPP